MGVYVPKDHPMLSARNSKQFGGSVAAINAVSPNKQIIRGIHDNNYLTNSSINSIQHTNTRNAFQQSHAGSAAK